MNAVQDLLVHCLRGLAPVALKAKSLGIDTHAAIQIALALANAFEVGVNDLPLSMILSWYEQKAVAVLLTLLHLGIKDIRLGPTLPAFISPNVFKLLSEQYHLQPITTPERDLAACLA